MRVLSAKTVTPEMLTESGSVSSTFSISCCIGIGSPFASFTKYSSGFIASVISFSNTSIAPEKHTNVIMMPVGTDNHK